METPALPRTHLVLGGARSGKSRHAEGLSAATGLQRVYVATARVMDDDMAERVTRHKLDRGAGWFTLEEPVDLPRAIATWSTPERVLLVECLTLWLTNLILDDLPVATHIRELHAAMRASAGPIILVSNEVGWGIVPDNALARRFTDEQGRLNQIVANLVDSVTLVTAGIGLRIK